MTSLHDDALATLRAWTPPSPEQRLLRDRYVDHLSAHADGVERACWPDHVTASCLVLDHERTSVLLTLHAKARRWFQFGGHLEPDDVSLAAAALREATEESGVAGLVLDPVPVHLDEHVVDFCAGRAGTHHLDVRFVALAPPGARHAVSDESLDVAWWPLDALPDPDLTDLVAAALVRFSTGSTPSRRL